MAYHYFLFQKSFYITNLSFKIIIKKLEKIDGIEILDVSHISRKLIKQGTEEKSIEYYYTEISLKDVYSRWLNAIEQGEDINEELYINEINRIVNSSKLTGKEQVASAMKSEFLTKKEQSYGDYLF